jgi:holo-[acyl-carrier protein] synthase
MRIHGIGIDVVEVERIASSIERHGEPFLAKLFTAAERAYCESRKNPAMHYAARFAAKEAVAKALGTGIGDVGWREIEIITGPRRQPALRLHGHARRLAESLGLRAWTISLSHTHEHAVAVAVALQEPGPGRRDPDDD